MTRPLLIRFIATHGISHAAIKLGTYPISLERMTAGIDPIPQDVAAQLANAWRAAYTPEQIERIEGMANSKAVELDEGTARELWEIAGRGDG